MVRKIIYRIGNYKFLSFTLVIFLIVMSGCKSNLLTGGEIPPPPPQLQPQAPPAPIVVDGVRTSYADVVDKTSPAVVRIDAERKASKDAPQQFPFADDPQFREFFKNLPQQPQQRPQIQRGLGSGVIISADGTVLTNHHVIDGAEKITVTMNDNKTFVAKVIGSDPPSDLAVLKIEGENLPFLNLGNSDNVRVGDIALAIGNPLGIGQTVTAGIISAKGRRTGLSDGSFEDFLQTDAPINRGNSGGALVNLNSELIGINSQILSSGSDGGSIGIGFSIPSNMAKSVMEQLLKDGKVHRGMLGVNIQNITANTAKALDLKDTRGVLVSNVLAGSAAEKAGIKRGDIIIAINGEAIEDRNVLRNKVAGTQPETEIKLTVLRDGKQEEFTARLDEFKTQGVEPDENSDENKKNQDNAEQNGKLGLSLQPLTPEIIKELELPADTKGLVVTEVDPSGAAAEEGITRGDVILEINKKQVSTTEDVQSALTKAGDKPILLLVTRKGQTIYLTVTPSK
ncbi:MAG: Do family serine endopeptidase [Acidobacteriota bacterium]|nr:Do family serine endopeptidase [Acidobacteriota bacterium]